jgi:hypothetical protein
MTYPLPILNELHDLYPLLLYQPSLFETSNDVVQYILEQSIHRTHRQELVRFQTQEAERERRQQLEESIARVRNSQEQQASQAEESEEEPERNDRSQLPPGVVPISSSSLEQLLTIIFEDALTNPQPRYPQSMRAPTLEQLARTTTIHTLTENHDGVCAICHEGMNAGHYIRNIHHCNHMFHQFCIDTWFSTHSTCPTCRHDVRR